MKIQRALCLGLMLCTFFGWWGVLYPQFALNGDTCRIVSGDGTVQKPEEVVEWEDVDEIYIEMLNADRTKIRLRSRLYEEVCSLWDYICGKMI